MRINDKGPSTIEEGPKIILVGGDHYNGLSLVRLFGKSGIKPFGIIVNEASDKGFLHKSKYWEQVHVVSDDSCIIEALNDMRGESTERAVVIPWSDGATAVLDANLDKLSDSYILPSIGGAQGAINTLMDKGKQIAFAAECGLCVAQSFEISLEDWESCIRDVPLPCIGKPIVSFAGEKKDIRKCETLDELKAYLFLLREKGYSRILLQKYVAIDAEYDVEGYVDGENSSYFVVRKVRTWPTVGGPTTYAYSVNERDVNVTVDRIVAHLKTIGYSGLFDVELFRVGSDLLFNEINWRNSAVCFAAVESGVKYPLYWYESVCGKVPHFKSPDSFSRYAMCELLDVHHVLHGKVGVRTWIREMRHCDAHAYYDQSDISPMLYKMAITLRRKIAFSVRHK